MQSTSSSNSQNDFKPEYLNCVPTFDGTPNDLNRYLATCQSLIDHFYIPSDPTNFRNIYLLNCLIGKLTGNAKIVINIHNVTTWDDLKETLYRHFADQRDETCLNRDLVMLRQMPNETPNQFYDKILHLLNLLCSYVDIHETMCTSKSLKRKLYNDLALKTFLSGLREPLGNTIRCMAPKDLPTALQFVTQEHNTRYFQNFSKPVPKIEPSQQNKFKPQYFNHNNHNLSQFRPFNNFNNHAPNNSLMPRPTFPSQPINIRPNFNNVPNRFPTNSQVFRRPNSNINVFKPNPNSQQTLPKPTPMSISTKQTSNIKPAFPNTTSYHPPPKFVFEELYNAETDPNQYTEETYPENLNFESQYYNNYENQYEVCDENYSEYQQQSAQYTQPDENFQSAPVMNTDT